MGERIAVNVDDLLSGRDLQSTARSHSEPLFNRSTAEKLLDLCEHIGVGVLGIEGFILSDQGLIPQMDFIADFSRIYSSPDFEAESVRLSRKFLSLVTNEPHLVFEFVLAALEPPKHIRK
ncbi:hypothetical protein [Rhodoblastus sp.]|uniref:hypothetical protein n=1 Tax=Rhodoblastus sp. TaxID=1962975 RepID=UPI0035B137A4